MKILQVTESFTPDIDGVASVVKNYAPRLNAIEECKVLAPARSKKSGYVDKESYQVIRCVSFSAPEKYREGLPWFDAKLKKRLDEEKFDIIHVHSPFLLGRYMVDYGKKAGIPTVCTLHTKYKWDLERSLNNSKPLIAIAMNYIMKTYDRADYVVTVNDATKSVLREYGYKKEIGVIHNGTEYCYPEEERVSELVRRVDEIHGTKGKKNVFLFVGRIAKYKNVFLIADALKILKDRGVDFTFFVVGSGFDEKAFKKRVNELGLERRVIFTGKVASRSLMQGYYLRSDLCIFPSVFDTCAIVKIEAAANKLPTLLIKDTCASSGTVDGENGFLTEENAKAIADKIEFAVKDKERLKEIGENAYRTVYRTWDDVVREALEVYRKVIADYNELKAAKAQKRKKVAKPKTEKAKKSSARPVKEKKAKTVKEKKTKTVKGKPVKAKKDKTAK